MSDTNAASLGRPDGQFPLLDPHNPDARQHDRRWFVLIGAAVAVGAAVRIWAALQWQMNFDSDEALFALMAKHMMHGFFSPVEYGTQHHGTLESLLSAGFMSLFGQSVPVFRLSAVVFMTTFLILAAYYFRTHWGKRVAFLATLFLAVPGFHILEWNYQPIGGYSVMMASGMGVLILADRIPSEGAWRRGNHSGYRGTGWIRTLVEPIDGGVFGGGNLGHADGVSGVEGCSRLGLVPTDCS